MSLSRLFRRGPTAPPPLPTGPFFYAVRRPDSPPCPPMSDSGEGLDEKPPQRPPAGDPPFAVGDHIGPLRFLIDRPENVITLWPLWLYEIGDLVDLVDLRWSKQGRVRPYPPVASDATIVREIPAWRYFGPRGEGVPEVLEQIWTLDPARIAALEVPPGRYKPRHIPIEMLDPPDNEPGPGNATSFVRMWMESRSWVSGVGGDFGYSGCYFVYRVTDPQWLVAMGLARNAVVALAARDWFAPATVDAALRAWQDLAG